MSAVATPPGLPLHVGLKLEAFSSLSAVATAPGSAIEFDASNVQGRYCSWFYDRVALRS
jgi:hypothetical protein